jgi:hypothetical protein
MRLERDALSDEEQAALSRVLLLKAIKERAEQGGPNTAQDICKALRGLSEVLSRGDHLELVRRAVTLIYQAKGDGA